MMRTLIIGGGAAGMAAAIAAARAGQAVTVLERGRRPLKKLGVTGNGRGNLLNAGAPDYPGGASFAAQVLAAMPYDRLAAFWEDLGVPLRLEEEGRVYPASLLASAAVDALLLAARRLGVEIIVNARVTALDRLPGGGFEARGTVCRYLPDISKKSGKTRPGALAEETPAHWWGDRVIVAAGGAAAPAHGTDGSAYGLLTAFGHELTPIRPALCALLAQPEPLRALAGLRARAALRLLDGRGACLAHSCGEALFAPDGVSGIAAMQLARWWQPGCSLHMDLREAVLGPRAAQATGPEALAETARLLRVRAQNREGCRLIELLTGAAPPALNEALLRAAGLERDAASPLADLAALLPNVFAALAQAIVDFRVPITGTRGFDAAQVTAGGVMTDGFDPRTLQSRLCPGLHAAGEVLDVDGACGGFNLMFATASGLLAGGAK